MIVGVSLSIHVLRQFHFRQTVVLLSPIKFIFKSTPYDTYVVSPFSWSTYFRCYLEWIYVFAEYSGKSITHSFYHNYLRFKIFTVMVEMRKYKPQIVNCWINLTTKGRTTVYMWLCVCMYSLLVGRPLSLLLHHQSSPRYSTTHYALHTFHHA